MDKSKVMPQIINNKRIAKNTIFLYLRQIVIMLVSLYTSRVILQILGEEDFGIYNVVGGVVILFTFLNSTLSSSTQRFLNFEMGKGDLKKVRDVFSMSINIHVVFGLVILLFAETIGLYVVSNYLNIDVERREAALWAYQFSILTTFLQMLRIPFGAIVIAYEKMNFYAYVSIVEAILRLAIVYVLLIFPYDKLILYSALFPVVQICLLIAYIIYTYSKFEAACYSFIWDKILLYRMMSFSGWSLLGGLSSTGSNYGLTLIMNVFCGVIVNAAMGIANQVNAAVGSLVSSFQLAFAPQIVKSYAAGDIDGFHRLIIKTSKFSFFIMLLMSVPVIIYAEELLGIWLVDIPKYTVIFVQLILVYSLIDAMSGPFWFAANATGSVKWYYIITSTLTFISLPIAYFLLLNGINVVWAVATRVIMNIIVHGSRVIIMKELTDFPVSLYLHNISRYILPIIVFCLIAFWLLPIIQSDLFMKFIILIVFFVSLMTVIYVFGFSKNEKMVMSGYLGQMIKNIKI